MADEHGEEDLFADLYDADETPSQPAPAEPAPTPVPAAVTKPSAIVPVDDVNNSGPAIAATRDVNTNNVSNGDHDTNGNEVAGFDDHEDNYGPVGIKEDGKMFIGGLNWETTDQSLKDYFSEFGDVLECTVMRDGATGRSRGFGFLTFKDPKTVNTVMVKEHYLDGKIIDPKRAIPREEQERTSKIFVGGVSQEATERDFKDFFMTFGRVVDATLMMDKDTGRPRGFGFVTFDGDDAVDRTLAGPLEILGKPIEVKRAQPRGNMHEDDRGGRFGRNKFNNRGQDGGNQQGQGFGGGAGNEQQQNQGMGGQGVQNGMSPAMMAQYWQRMQNYFAMMQQQMASNVQGQMNPMAAMGGQMNAAMGNQMNPAMMQQMMAMQQAQQAQQQQPVRQGTPGGTPIPQSPGPDSQGGMNQAMMQQMQNQQQPFQNMPTTPQGAGQFGPPSGPGSGGGGRSGFTPQEQQIFEQQKYEQQHQQQQQQRMQQNQQYSQAYGGGGASWEGMYDDVPAPNQGGGQGFNQGGGGGHHGGHQGGFHGGGKGKWQNRNRGGGGQGQQPPAGPSNAPANAPTGPKNAGKPGANYRGGGRGGNRGWRPY